KTRPQGGPGRRPRRRRLHPPRTATVQDRVDGRPHHPRRGRIGRTGTVTRRHPTRNPPGTTPPPEKENRKCPTSTSADKDANTASSEIALSPTAHGRVRSSPQVRS